MNKYVLLLFICLLSSCIGKHKSDAQKALVNPQVSSSMETWGDTLKIDLSKSKIFWKGTKMQGAGKHEGVIQLNKGFFVAKGSKLVGGGFLVNMHSIEVTDIPKSDPIPIENLTNHLKDDDFFDVENYPTSRFEISSIEKLALDSLKVLGNLTLKDITKSIEFSALNRDKTFSTKFTIDRFQWNIAYEGNWADKTLVDKDIELTIELVIE